MRWNLFSSGVAIAMLAACGAPANRAGLERAPKPEFPDVELEKESVRYTVKGTTHQAIQLGLKASGLRDDDGDAAGFGKTETEISVVIEGRMYADGCAIERATARVAVRVLLPDWIDRAAAAPALRQKWDDFFAALERHEEGHVRLALQYATRIRPMIEHVGPQDSCDALERAMKELNQRFAADLKRAQKEYDANTRHGVDQGAVF